jgi:DNA replication protein DnaC
MTTKKTDDDLEQLCASLKLTQLGRVLERELTRAEKQGSTVREVLARLLREEYLYRRDQSMTYRIRQARLPERWTIESFPFEQQPGVNRTQIRQLAELDFVARAANLVLIGQTGVGKTGLASGILMKALENGYRGLFVKAQDLFDEMYASLADRSSRRLINRLVRIDVLLIDELGYLNLRPEQSNIFFKLMEERYRRKSTIISTNLDYEQWYEFLGQKTMVEALLSRLRHHAPRCASTGRRCARRRTDHSAPPAHPAGRPAPGLPLRSPSAAATHCAVRGPQPAHTRPRSTLELRPTCGITPGSTLASETGSILASAEDSRPFALWIVLIALSGGLARV